jgi:hypothetical protein
VTHSTTDGTWWSYIPAPRNESSLANEALRPASSPRSRSSSGSDSGGGIASRPVKRSQPGMSSNSASTESTPIAASISARSWSVVGV